MESQQKPQEPPTSLSSGTSNIPDDNSQVDAPPAPISLSASVLISNLPTDTTQLLNQVIAKHSNAQSDSTSTPEKVMLKLKPIGSAPLLKQSVYRISGTQKFATLVKYLRKQLKCGPQQSIFCYINNSFAPQLDVPLNDLYDAYQIDGHLIVSYCYTMAFG